MFSKLLIFPILLVAHSVLGNPVKSRDVPVVDGVAELTAAPLAGRDVVALEARANIPSIPGEVRTSPNTGLHSLSARLAESFIICTDVNCGGTCYAFALTSLAGSTCYTSSVSFFSAYVYVGSPPPYSFDVGTADCYDQAAVNGINTCNSYGGIPVRTTLNRYP